jgi:hypothetical protein
MKRIVPIVAALCFLLPMGAAAQPVDKTVLTRIHIIALVAIAEPDGYVVVSARGNGSQYDSRTFIPGAGAEAAQQTFGQAIAAQKLRLGAELYEAVTDALKHDGYRIVSSGQAADAALEIAFPPGTVQYSDAVLGDDLMPTFAISVRLIDTRTRAVLLGERILYGQPADRNAHALYPDARYRFSSVDALLADPVSAAEGLHAGIASIAQEIGKELAK